jgi:hypothetical protein
LAVALALLIQVAFFASFVVAQVNPQPHGVPVAVVGPPAAVGALQEAAERRHPGAFSLRRMVSSERARDALAEREVYGALIVEGRPAQLLVASAASPAVANMLRRSLGRVGGRPVAVRDAYPLDPGDPRGLLINLVLLPLVVTAVLAPLLLRFLVFLIVGNVASGAAGAHELLPGFWRTVGEFLPPGAAATALRNAAYFPAASLLQPLAVLAIFVVAGAAVELALGPRQAGRALVAGAPTASEEDEW